MTTANRMGMCKREESAAVLGDSVCKLLLPDDVSDDRTCWNCNKTGIINSLVLRGNYIYRQFTFSNSTFCPHSVFMCFVWI